MVIRLKLDGYIRVSRIGAREGEGYISPDVQREAIAAYAKELGGGIVHWADDQDMTGGTVDRPAFQSVLERIASGQTDGVVEMGIDRFARSVADGTTIVRKILNGGGIFASCNERIGPRTPEGSYMLNQFFNNAELFLNHRPEVTYPPSWVGRTPRPQRRQQRLNWLCAAGEARVVDGNRPFAGRCHNSGIKPCPTRGEPVRVRQRPAWLVPQPSGR